MTDGSSESLRPGGCGEETEGISRDKEKETAVKEGEEEGYHLE